MKHIRSNTAFNVYLQAIAQLRDEPDQFSFSICSFNGKMAYFDLARDEVSLAGDVQISEGLMSAAFLLKIGALLARGTPPSFRKEELEARASASGTVRGALQWALRGPPQTGWALIPLCRDGTWSLVVVEHGAEDNGGCVFSSGYGLSLMI